MPESVIEHEVNHHLQEEGRLDDAEHRAEVNESTRRALKAQFILDALVGAGRRGRLCRRSSSNTH